MKAVRFVKDNIQELGLIALMAAVILIYMTWLHWLVLTTLIDAVTPSQ